MEGEQASVQTGSMEMPKGHQSKRQQCQQHGPHCCKKTPCLSKRQSCAYRVDR